MDDNNENADNIKHTPDLSFVLNEKQSASLPRVHAMLYPLIISASFEHSTE